MQTFLNIICGLACWLAGLAVCVVILAPVWREWLIGRDDEGD